MQLVGSGSLFADALLLSAALSLIPLGVAFIVGLVTGILQAATQIQEQTLSFIPKLICVSVSIAIIAPWLGQQFVEFFKLVLEQIVPYARSFAA